MEDRELGRRIAYWRRRRGLTQIIFADRLGRSKSWVSKIESGQRSAGRLASLDLICEVLRVDLSTLLGEDPERRGEACLDDGDVERIQSALERYTLLSTPTDTAPDLAALRRQVEHVWAAFEFAEYGVVGQVLPDLIATSQTAHASLNVEASRQLLAEIYQITSSTLRKLGEHNLAWLAADRGMTLAHQSGDSALAAATGFRVANALLSMGRSRQALSLNISIAETVQSDDGNEPHRALYGHVLLQACIAAATAGDHAQVHDLIREAATAARFVPTTNNYFRLAFSPTNVTLHEVSALLALGEAGQAIEAAKAIGGDLPTLRKERRAALQVDVARAYSHIGKRDEALHTLLEAEATAAREVRCRPVAQATIADLLRRSPDRPSLVLSQLAERSRVQV